jgi:protein-tyrosine phosphatase
MVDTHCHLLPALDDGPSDEEAALRLAEALRAEGVRRVVATPHVSRRYPTDPEEAEARVVELRERLSRAGIDLEVLLGAELSPARAAVDPAMTLARRAIAGRHLLVEATATTPVGALVAVCDRIAGLGLTMVLAHPERCVALRRTPAALDALRHAGALIQVLAPSLTGDGGGDASESAWRLLRTGRADLVASDAHDVARRAPRMGAAARLVERRMGPDVRERLFSRTPAQVIGHGTPVADHDAGASSR